MTNDEIMDDITKPITWRHRFVQWIAHILGVRLYSAPAIVLIDMRPSGCDGPKLH